MDWLTTTRFAHRGLHDIASGIPENSCAAFDGAAAAGYGMELDARLSADGVAMVFHDGTLEGLTDHTGPVAARTAEELGRIRILETYETIPQLSDALALVDGRTPVLVEIKNHNRPVGPLEAAVADVIASYAGACGILSFNPHSVRWFRDNAPHIPRGRTIIGLWTSSGGMPFWRRLVLRVSAAMVRCDPDFLAYDLPALPVRSRRLPVLTWTIRTGGQQTTAEKSADSYIFEDMRP
jgi:glycerophosphoryl diester phosphodiesterase